MIACLETECSTKAVKGYLNCYRHGGGKRCDESECNRAAYRGSKCKRHYSGKIATCSKYNCTLVALPNGLCRRHTGQGLCALPVCTNPAKYNSKCITHGGGKCCSVSGCTALSQGGFKTCVRHGGKKKCIEPGCTSMPQIKSRCIFHGFKRCDESNCKRRARINCLKCKRHGCTVSGCGRDIAPKETKCVIHVIDELLTSFGY